VVFGEQIVDVSYARAADGGEPWVLCLYRLTSCTIVAPNLLPAACPGG